MKNKHYQLIKEKYEKRGKDFTELFQTILSVADGIGLDKALKYLEKCVIEKRLAWINQNLKNIKKTGSPISDAYRIFFEVYLGLSVPKDGKIVEKTDKRIVMRWQNFCPVLEVCKKLGLDTRVICKKAYHQPVQAFLSKIHPKLKFKRNYQCIRPHATYCEEIIELEENKRD